MMSHVTLFLEILRIILKAGSNNINAAKFYERAVGAQSALQFFAIKVHYGPRKISYLSE